MLPLRFEIFLVATLVCLGNQNVNGIYVMPYGYDHFYDPHDQIITEVPTPTTTTPRPRPTTTTTTVEPTIETSTPPETTTTTTMAPVTTTTTRKPPCLTPPTSHRDEFLIKYYHQYNYFYPNIGRIPVDIPPIHRPLLPSPPINSPPVPSPPIPSPPIHNPPIPFPPVDDTTVIDPPIFQHGVPRQSAPLRHPAPITQQTTYMTGPNSQGTMVTLVSSSNSPQSCSSSTSSAQAQSGVSVGWQGIGASSWRGYNPHGGLFNFSRTWFNYPPSMYQPLQVYPID